MDGWKYERIDLNLPKKEIIRINCAEVSNTRLKDNLDCKIIITGTVGELKAIIKHPNVLQWKDWGYKISTKEKQLEKSVITEKKGEQLRYSHILYEQIKADEKLVKIYQQVFN